MPTLVLFCSHCQNFIPFQDDPGGFQQLNPAILPPWRYFSLPQRCRSLTCFLSFCFVSHSSPLSVNQNIQTKSAYPTAAVHNSTKPHPQRSVELTAQCFMSSRNLPAGSHHPFLPSPSHQRARESQKGLGWKGP